VNLSKINRVYFIGIGGIGMSALARYFHIMDKVVGGYDRTMTKLTGVLEDMGMQINFSDDIASIPSTFRDLSDKEEILVIYTPAIPAEAIQLKYFQDNGYRRGQCNLSCHGSDHNAKSY
jgi:UDP-N-acetylmuramate--alanine ligase